MRKLNREIILLRAALRLSQVEFARVLYVSQAAVSDWERGRRRPKELSVRVMNMIARERGLKEIEL